MPMNGPVNDPRSVVGTTTLSASAIKSSMVVSRSGKAERSLNAFWPENLELEFVMAHVAVGDHLLRQFGPALVPNLGEEPSDQRFVGFGIHRREASPLRRGATRPGCLIDISEYLTIRKGSSDECLNCGKLIGMVVDRTGRRAASESHGERPLVVY